MTKPENHYSEDDAEILPPDEHPEDTGKWEWMITPEEAEEGHLLGEQIDTDDDDDTGLPSENEG